MDNKVIEYYKKNVYGIEKLYVKDGELAKVIMSLTQTKTLMPHQMRALEALGFTFEQVIN